MAQIKNTFVNVKKSFGTIACDTVILCILNCYRKLYCAVLNGEVSMDNLCK